MYAILDKNYFSLMKGPTQLLVQIGRSVLQCIAVCCSVLQGSLSGLSSQRLSSVYMCLLQSSFTYGRVRIGAVTVAVLGCATKGLQQSATNNLQRCCLKVEDDVGVGHSSLLQYLLDLCACACECMCVCVCVVCVCVCICACVCVVV